MEIKDKIEYNEVMMNDNENKKFIKILKDDNWIFSKTSEIFSPITCITTYDIVKDDEKIELEVDDWFFFYKISKPLFIKLEYKINECK